MYESSRSRPETGKVDVALVEGVTPRNDSDTMTVICSVLKQLEKEWEGKVPEKVLYSELEANITTLGSDYKRSRP